MVHDWFYWEQTITRHEADDLFDAPLGMLQVPSWKGFAIYRSVRIFGGKYWDDNIREKENGGRRVVIKFPTEPNTTWEQLRATPGVFA